MMDAPNIPLSPVAADRTRATASVPLLSHLRWIAAVVVVFSHLEQNILNKGGNFAATGPLETGLVAKPLMGFGGYGHAAVVIFFVLSGFLVGGKLVELFASPRLRSEWPSFLVDRFSRIFIVLVPVTALTALILAALLWSVPDAPFVHSGLWTFDLIQPLTADLSWTRWAGALVMLNDVLVPTLDSNGPLWSLAYEWSYYIIGLAAVLAYRRVFSPPALVVILYGAALLLLSAFNQPNILFAGLSWVAGIAARLAFNADALRGRAMLLAGVLGTVLLLAIEAVVPLPDPVLGLGVALMIAHPAWRRWRWLDATGERLASFSFTLYALHFPLMLGIMGLLFAAGAIPPRLPFDLTGLATVVAVFAILMICARVFARCTEDQTVGLRRALSRWLGLRRDRLPAPDPASGPVRVPDAARPDEPLRTPG